MTRIIALTALTALGLPGGPFHEPFHEPTTAGATQRYHAPSTFPVGAADNGSAPGSLRAQNRSVGSVRPLDRQSHPGGIEADVQIVGQVQGRAGCSRMEGAGRPACTSRSVLLLRGWLCGVAWDGQVEQDHGVVVGSAGIG
jgi:hypothetical protein